jgi:hypothetical protein
VWKEVMIASIEMSASVGGCREGKARRKLGNNSAFIAQSISTIKKRTL